MGVVNYAEYKGCGECVGQLTGNVQEHCNHQKVVEVEGDVGSIGHG